MKKRIDGRVYDTRRATLIGSLEDDSITTAVFKTKSGAFFVLKYAGGDARNPSLGAIGPATQAEAELLAARPGFRWEAPGAFDGREQVRTSMELSARDRDLLGRLCRVRLDGTRRERRIGMGEAVGELLDLARETRGFGADSGAAVAGGLAGEEAR